MTTAHRDTIRTSILSVLGAFLAAHVCFWLLPNVFEAWNAQSTDQLFVLRSSAGRLQPPYDPSIVHVDIDDSTIQRLEGPYVNRSHFARVITNLASMGVAAQAYDIIFAGPRDERGDRALIDATKDAANVYFGLAFGLSEGDRPHAASPVRAEILRYLDRAKWEVSREGDTEGFYAGLPSLATFLELASAARGVGHLNVKFDADGVLRRMPLLVRYGGAFFPSLSFRVACECMGVRPEGISVRPGRHILLRGAKWPQRSAPSDIAIPIDSRGNTVINFIGPWERMNHYSFADIFFASDDPAELELWRNELQGKMVLVSDVSTGSGDTGRVPTDTHYPLSGAHTNVLNSILMRSLLRELSVAEMIGVEIVLMAGVMLLSIRFSSILFSLSTLGLGCLYFGAVAVCFLVADLILNVIRPLLMLTLAMGSVVIQGYIREEREKIEGLRQRDFIRATFGRYLSNEVVDELLGSREALNMGGELRVVTFLVSDLRGFTPLASRLNPQQVIPIVNRYFEAMVEIIGRYRGTVDEFQGDGILVFFGAPLRAPDDPERAVACAIEMQNRMIEVNRRQRLEGLPELQMGIAIHTGDVIVGNIGSEKRTKYGAVGTAINMAYRIQTCTGGGQILASEKTYQEVMGRVEVRDPMEVRLKGIDGMVTLYDITGIKGKVPLRLESQEKPGRT